MNNSAIAIIPARGGSKRIPRKNIKPFYGKPMITYAIDKAQRSKLFDHIVVSTDDEEIAHIAVKCGVEVPFVRPKELSDDYTPTVPVIAHAIRACQKLGWQFNEVCCIYSTVPFLQETDLILGLQMLKTNQEDLIFPITTFPSPIQRALRLSPNGFIEPFYPQYTTIRTQDLEPAFYDAGQFYWGLSQIWLSDLTNYKAKGLLVPSWRVVDIDTPEDWEHAELIFRTMNSMQVNSQS